MWPLIQIGTFVVPTYWLIISIAFCLGIWWVTKRAQHRELPVPFVLDLCLAIMIGGFAGARLFHVVFEHPDLYWSDPARIFQFWAGGYVFFGGFLGAFALSYVYIRVKRLPLGLYLDVFTPPISLGYMIGRMACFSTGCCYGRPTDLPWAINFPQGVEAPAGAFIHPTQLYAVAWESILLAAILVMERRSTLIKPFAPGTLFYTWLTFHAIGRIIMEAYRDDERGPVFAHLSLSTWISLLLLFFALIRVYIINRGQRHHATSY